MSSGYAAVAVPDDHALDAVLAWLDNESLLRAGAACRRWRERTTRRDAWRGRVAEVGWTRGMHPRDAYVRSLDVRARWRRRCVAVTELPRNLKMLCADGDWLVCGHETMLPRDGVYGRSPCVRIYDAATTRTVAELAVHARAAALSRTNALCASLSPRAALSPVCDMRCDVWAPPRAGGRWRAACTVPIERTMSAAAALRWQGDTLLVYDNCCTAAGPSCYAEWFDVGAGAARSVSRREYDDIPTGGQLVCSGPLAMVASGWEIRVLDPRTRDVVPLMTLRREPADHPIATEITALDDGRHIAMQRYVRCVELWDVRAARADATPVARLRDVRWHGILCATARGTVLGYADRPCPRHTAVRRACGIAIEEWDTVRGSAEALLEVGDACDAESYGCAWADERRAVVMRVPGTALLFDADATTHS